MPDIIQARGPGLPQIKFVEQPDGTHAEVVAVVGGVSGGGGSSVDREVVVTTYRVIQDGTGYTVGQILTATRVLDVSGATATQVGLTAWFNESTGAAISAPNSGHIEVTGQPGLTNAQLRAQAVSVSVVNTPNVDVSSSALPTGAATAALQTSGNTTLNTIAGRLPPQLIDGLLPVDTLATIGVARQLAAGAASANTALTTTCRRISIHARGADIRFAVGTGAQTASATSHFIASGERLDFDVPASAQIAVIRAGTTDGTLELSELGA